MLLTVAYADHDLYHFEVVLALLNEGMTFELADWLVCFK